MLENSQMKENMLLQYSDDMVKVGLQSLRAEVLELMAQSGGSCTAAVEAVARRSETKLQQDLSQLTSKVMEHQTRQEEVLQQILETGREQTIRLGLVEGVCLDGRVKSLQTRHLEEENREVEDRGRLVRSLQVMSDDLQSLREHVVFYTQAMASKIIPAGRKLEPLILHVFMFLHESTSWEPGEGFHKVSKFLDNRSYTFVSQVGSKLKTNSYCP